MKQTDSANWLQLLEGLWQTLAPKERELELVLKWLVVNKVEAELFVEDTKIVMCNTAVQLAVAEGGQSGVVMCFELRFVIGRGSDVVQLEIRRVLQAAEAETRVSEI